VISAANAEPAAFFRMIAVWLPSILPEITFSPDGPVLCEQAGALLVGFYEAKPRRFLPFAPREIGVEKS
jgi:hypothetical protein